MTTTTKRYGLVAVCLLLAGLLLMAAFGSANSSATSSYQNSGAGQLVGATPSPAGGYGSYGSYGDSGPSASASAGVGRPGGQLAVRVDDKLGSVMTDGQGFTLYRFDKDTSKPPASNCAGGCATTWPPVIKDTATMAGTGIDPGKLGEIVRADGTHQLTVSGWPAYRYAQDAAPGDTKGQGVGGTWNALAPDGTKAQAGSAGAPAPTASATTAMPQPTQQQQPPAGMQISILMHPQLGPIMVDVNGRTLYHFAKDTAWPMRSNCDAQCLKTWTPAAPVDPTKIKGVDPKLVGKMQRPDGTWQLSINCTPAYLYTGDQGYGDALGNGINNLWSAINPQGKPAGK